VTVGAWVASFVVAFSLAYGFGAVFHS